MQHLSKNITSLAENLFFLKNNRISRVQWFFLSLCLVVFYLFPSYYFPLIDMDEGAYAAVSREMFMNGNWLVTMLNGEPFFHKPALMYWTQSVGLFIFGEERFSYRFPSIVAFLIWLYVSYQFTKRYLDPQAAWYFIWISIFSIGVLFSLKAAIPDAWLILFISLGVYKAYEFINKNDNKALAWVFIWTGFGILAKGPVAFVIISGTVFLFLLMDKNWKLLFKAILFWKGWVLLFAVVLPWYLLQVYLFGQKFLDEFFGVHNVGRFMSAMESHDGNVFYYVFDLIFLTLPFLPILIMSFIPWFKQSQESGVHRMMFIWFILVFIFFTIAATKLPHYLMYGVPPVLIMMSYYFRQMDVKWGLGATLFGFSVLLIMLPNLIEYAAFDEKDPYHYATLHEASLFLPYGYYFVVVIMALVGLILIFSQIDKVYKLFITGLVSALTFTFALFAYAVNLQQQPIIGAAEFVKQNQLQVVTCCIEMPSFNIETQQLTPMREPQVGEIVFGKKHELAKFKKVDWLYTNRGVAIAKIVEK
ncbi:MAG: glycosyltransferase family 39 protein [Pseudomonadota bacterium]|nr:glycosyltransferase family 39 protein [Pseudomonadota bacterium]